MPKSRLRKWILRILFILISLILLFFLVFIPLFVTHFMTHAGSRPMDLRITTTPQDLGAPFQDIIFPSKTPDVHDSLQISAWYMPHENPKGLIIYSHGLFRSRQEVLQRAVDLWHSGYAGLLLDFRRHGKSGDGKTSMGYLERQDVLGAIAYAKDSLNLQIPIVTYGVSMGAAATLLANSESTQVDAIIIDSSFRSFDHTVSHHLKLWLGWPRFPIGSIITVLAKWRIGFTDEQFDMRVAIDKIGARPIFVIAGEADTRMPPEIAEELYSHCQGEKQLYIVPDARHGRAYEVDPTGFVERVDRFLTRVTKLPANNSSTGM